MTIGQKKNSYILAAKVYVAMKSVQSLVVHIDKIGKV